MNLKKVSVATFGFITTIMVSCSNAKIVDYNTALAHVKYYYTHDNEKGSGHITKFEWDFSKTTGDKYINLIKNSLKKKYDNEELKSSKTDNTSPFTYAYVTYRVFKANYKNEQVANAVNAVFTLEGKKLTITADAKYTFEGSAKDFKIRQSDYLDENGLPMKLRYEFNNCHDDNLGEGYISGWMIETPEYNSR